MKRIYRGILIVLIAALSAAAALAQASKEFTVPLDDLKTWSEKVLVSMSFKIRGHSKVHKIESDCEMHFGAEAPSYKGDPDGWVLEPMNLCLEPFFGKSKQVNADWERFGDSLTGVTLKGEGVPRIWPEHLKGGNEASNPNHAMEIHPLTKLTRGSKEFDFTAFISAPEDFKGGVSLPTAQAILEDTEVTVTEDNGKVKIEFDSGRIGNFTTLLVQVAGPVESAEGGHRANGKVTFGSDSTDVRLVTVKGTKIDETIARLKPRRRGVTRLSSLVLFSLSPEALFEAAKRSGGRPVKVENPIQLILYGEPGEE